MIRYALRCPDGHAFESWFGDAAAFDDLAARRLVACPACDSRDVEKAIMAPAIVARRAQPSTAPPEPSAPPETESKAIVPLAPNAEPQTVAPVDDERRQMIRALHQKIVADTRDVGSAFADEARRIHSNDTRERIRGQASLEEARDLIEEGIMVLPLPMAPDDLN